VASKATSGISTTTSIFDNNNRMVDIRIDIERSNNDICDLRSFLKDATTD